MYKTKPDYQTFVNQNIRTNGQQGITGAILNQALIDQSDSVNWGIAQQLYRMAILDIPVVVPFAVPFPDNNYVLQIRSYDTNGDPLDYRITDILPESFTITGAVAGGTVDWRATHD